MIALVIVVFHEARQGALEFPRATVLLELDDVLHRPVVAFDLSLRHGVRGRAPRMRQTVRIQVVGQLLRDVAWAIITKQPVPMDDPHPVHPGLGSGQVERLGHVRRLHRRPKRPRQDVARVIVEHGRQVVPAPPDNLQVGEVGLPQLVGPVRRMSKCLGRREHHIRRTGDQILGFEDAIHAGLREKVALPVRALPRQLAGRLYRIGQGGLHDGIVKLKLTAVFDAQHGGFTTGGAQHLGGRSTSCSST